MKKVLDGIKVIEVASMAAAPSATMNKTQLIDIYQ